MSGSQHIILSNERTRPNINARSRGRHNAPSAIFAITFARLLKLNVLVGHERLPAFASIMFHAE
jgi:hypothetical protein